MTNGPAILTGVQVEQDTSADRVVFECDGPLPEAQVTAVPQPDPTRPGRVVLGVALEPATYQDQPPVPPAVEGFAALRQVAAGWHSFTRVTWGISTADRTALRVQRLPTPARVVVEVDHAEPGIGCDVLEEGDESAAVATWQWRLHLALSRSVPVDENFGPVTRAATEEFQGAHGLTSHGRLDPRTRAAMARLLELPEEDVLETSEIRAAAAFLLDAAERDGDLVGPLGEVFSALGFVVRTVDTECDQVVADRAALRPYVLTEQLRMVARALGVGSLVTGRSFVEALGDAGAGIRPGTGGSLTWEDLTDVVRPITEASELGRRDLLPALVACLGQERATRRGDHRRDPVWGDEYLDPLQLLLLHYAVSYAPKLPRPF